MLARCLKMAFWVGYDHLGKWLLINMLIVLSLFTGSGIIVLISTFELAGLLLAMPLFLGMLIWFFASILAVTFMIKELIEQRDVTLRHFLCGLQQSFRKRIVCCFMHIFIGICIIFAVYFYTAIIGASIPWLGYTLSVLAIWAIAFWGLITLILPPALTWKSEGYWAVLKLCALLVLDNPVFMLGLLLASFILATLALMPPMVLLFSVVPQVILVTCAYEVLSRKYALLEALPENRKRRLRLEDWKDEEDDFLNRGIRDIIFPWKS